MFMDYMLVRISIMCKDINVCLYCRNINVYYYCVFREFNMYDEIKVICVCIIVKILGWIYGIDDFSDFNIFSDYLYIDIKFVNVV